MTDDLFENEIEPAVEPAIEPEAELEPEVEPAIEPEAAAWVDGATAAKFVAITQPAGLVELLPADFKLPLLTKFVPNPALRQAADQAASYALALEVVGAEGLQRADLGLAAIRASIKAIEHDFEEPTEIANSLHKRLTSMKSEWLAGAKQAAETVGRRIWTENKRLADLEAEQKRKDQEKADQEAREAARREAEAAEKAKAPAPVVEELKRQAETATAPPVRSAGYGSGGYARTGLSHSSTVTTWKARIKGTPGSDEPNPEIADLSPAQRLEVFNLLRAILDGNAPLVCIGLAWPYLNSRAKADKSTMDIPGVESFEEGGTRAKRGKK